MDINRDTVISRSTRLAQRLFEERMLIVTPDDSMLHRLDHVGTFIWRKIEEPRTVRQLCALIQEHYDGFDGASGAEDVYRFLQQLKEKGMIETA